MSPANRAGLPPDLGYRGLVIGEDRVGVKVRLYAGIEGGDRVLADPGRKLEKWLLSTGIGRIEAELLQAVAAELAN